MNDTIKFCGCTADKFGNTSGAKFQDQQYGRGNRVHTLLGDKSLGSCSVCGKSPTNKVKK